MKNASHHGRHFCYLCYLSALNTWHRKNQETPGFEENAYF